MKKPSKPLFIIIFMLTLVACEDHVRDSQFDAGADGFTPLPPATVFIYDVEHQPISGEVVSITFAVLFLDTLVHDFYLYHTLTYDNKVVWNLGEMFPKNYQGYLLKFHWYTQFWPVGEYSFAVYWGEMAVGGVPFYIEVDNGVYTVRRPIDLMHRKTGARAPVETFRIGF